MDCNSLHQFVEEGIEFDEEFMSEQDPSILHFMIASGAAVVTIDVHM